MLCVLYHIFASEIIYFQCTSGSYSSETLFPHPPATALLYKAQDITCHMTGAGRYWLS